MTHPTQASIKAFFSSWLQTLGIEVLWDKKTQAPQPPVPFQSWPENHRCYYLPSGNLNEIQLNPQDLDGVQQCHVNVLPQNREEPFIIRLVITLYF